MKQHHKTTGQALVEFALAATLIFFLLAAAVDVGLAFFALQGLRNAAQEGAQFGSDNLMVNDAGEVMLNIKEIRNRVRNEGGENPRSGFVNLHDLDDDGQEDPEPTDDPNDPFYKDHIQVEAKNDADSDGDFEYDNISSPPAPEEPCNDPARVITPCYVVVTVRAQHHIMFPFAPTFADHFTLQSRQYMLIRSSVSQGNK